MATAKKTLALSEYVSSGKGKLARGNPCWLCGVPERDEIDAALRSDGPTNSPSMIRRWMIDERGYDPGAVTLNKIRHHKEAGHHERA